MTWYARDSEVLNNFSAIGFSLSLLHNGGGGMRNFCELRSMARSMARGGLFL